MSHTDDNLALSILAGNQTTIGAKRQDICLTFAMSKPDIGRHGHI